MKLFSSAEKWIGASHPYNTQGTSSALRKALVATLPTLSLFDPLIVIDFITFLFVYIKNCPLIEVLSCTLCITSANKGAQDTTFILEIFFFNGIVSVTINSVNAEFSIFS